MSVDAGKAFAVWKREFLKLAQRTRRTGSEWLVVEFSREFVRYVGEAILRARAIRAEVRMDSGLAAWDAELGGLTQRYAGIYQRFFDGAPADVEAWVSTWDEDMWAGWYDVINPLVLWTAAECREQWGIPLVPACKGPDLLLAMQLLDGIFEAAGGEYDATDPWSHPVLFLIRGFEGYGERLLAEAGEVFGAAARSIIEAAGDAARYVGKALGIWPWVIGGALGVVLIAKVAR